MDYALTLPDYLAKLRFDTQQLATLRALGEYRGKQQLYVAQSPEVLSDLRQVAVVESTESSNRLKAWSWLPVGSSPWCSRMRPPRAALSKRWQAIGMLWD